MMRCFLIMLIALVPLPGSAQQATWHLLSREEGCIDLTILVEAEKLPRVPTSPEDYAQMMRERGKDVRLEQPKDVPSDFKGKIVQVRVGNEAGGLVFAKDEVCRKITK
jgi:hypothetical protein